MTLPRGPEFGNFRFAVEAPPRRERGLELPPPGQTSNEPPPPRGRGRWLLAGGAAAVGIGSVAVPYYAEHPDRLNPQYILQDAAAFAGSALNKALEFTQGWNWFKGEALAAPATFDPKATKGVIGPENSVQVTPQEYINSGQYAVENNTVHLPFMIKPPEGKGGSVIKYQIDKVQIEGMPTRNGVIYLSNIDFESDFLSFVEGTIDVGNGGGFKTDGSWNSASFVIKGKDANGTDFSATIATEKMLPLKEGLTGRKSIGQDSTQIPIRIGEPIMRVLSRENSRFYPGQIAIWIHSKGGVNIEIATALDGKALTL